MQFESFLCILKFMQFEILLRIFETFICILKYFYAIEKLIIIIIIIIIKDLQIHRPQLASTNRS